MIGREEKGKDTHYEGHVETACKCNYYVNPPQSPCLFKVRLGLGFLFSKKTYKFNGSISPSGNTDKNDHIDDGCKTHWKGTDEERLGRMSDHGPPYFRENSVPNDGDNCKSNEQRDIQAEYDY